MTNTATLPFALRQTAMFAEACLQQLGLIGVRAFGVRFVEQRQQSPVFVRVPSKRVKSAA